MNLDYTQIQAPVSGRISREGVTEGNLVSGGTATSTLLTTIASVAPIYCTLSFRLLASVSSINLRPVGATRA